MYNFFYLCLFLHVGADLVRFGIRTKTILKNVCILVHLWYLPHNIEMVRHKKILQSSYQHVYRKKIAIYVLRVTYFHWQVTLHSRLQQNICYTFYNSTDVRIPSRVPTLCMSGRGNYLNNIRTCRSFYVIKNFMFCSYYNYSSTCIIYEVFTR